MNIDTKPVEISENSVFLVDDEVTQIHHNFLESIIHEQKSASTYKSYRFTIQDFLHWIATRKKKPVSKCDMTHYHIEQYMHYLQVEKGHKPSTVHVKLTLIQKFVRFFFQQQKEIPAYAIQVQLTQVEPAQPSEPCVLTLNEITLLLKQVKRLNDVTLLTCLAYTGMRIHECIQLTHQNVDMDRRVIRIWSCKTKTHRTVQMNDVLYQQLQTYLQQVETKKDTDYFFLNHLHKPYNATTINRLLKRVTKQLGWNKHVTCHTFRHSFATNLILKDVNLPTVASLLGHKDYRVITKRYIHLNEQIERNAVEQLIC